MSKATALAVPAGEPPRPPDWWMGEPQTSYLRRQLHKLPIEARRPVRSRAFELNVAAAGRATVEDCWTQAITEAKHAEAAADRIETDAWRELQPGALCGVTPATDPALAGNPAQEG